MSKGLTPTRKYLLILGLFIGLAPLLAGINYVFLVNSQEFEHIDQIIKIQSQNDALYYPALRMIHYSYKLAMFKQVKPRVVALGSSRVFEIRSPYFTVPFVNLGGAMGSFKEGAQLLKEMVASHKPEVILLGLDPWWFSGTGDILNGGNPHATGEEFQLDMIFLPFNWLLKGKVSLSYYCQALLGKNPAPFPTIGVFAGANMEGFYKDGSFYHFGRIAGKRNFAIHRRFAHDLEEISKGEHAFKYDQVINKDRLLEFVALVQFAQRENIRLITFLTPLPGQLIDLMTKMDDKYAYIDKLRLKLPEVDAPYYDFFDPRSFGSCDCEFVDGSHGGEITYLRIIQEIGQDPASGLGPYLHHARIAACINQYQGKAMVPPSFYKQPYTEGDFLGLGCKKN